MFFVLYDRNMKSIGETNVLESWNRKQRATDFDDINLVGEQIPYSANPFLVVINDRQGRQMFSGLASTPAIDDRTKKTSISLKDYMTLFNSDIVINWDEFNKYLITNKTVSDFITFVFDTWKEQIDVGFENIVCDTSALSEIALDKEVYSFSGLENVLAYSLLSNAINYYDLYCEPWLNVETKTLTFHFKKALLNTAEIKLSDFGIQVIEKSFGDYNRVTVYDYLFNKRQEWALTESNKVVKLPSEEILVYPAKNRNFIADKPEENSDGTKEVNDAIYEAVAGLAENRYQENIDLNAEQNRSIVDLTQVDFSFLIRAYMPDGTYKSLPVGEIETDSKGKHVVKLGYRIQELTQEL